MSKSRTAEDMLNSLESDAAAYFDYGKSNNVIDITLTISTILTSLVAAVVASSDISKWIRVGIAAVPAACTSIQKVIDVRKRSNWYFTYAARLRALAVTVEYASTPNLEEFAKKRAAIDIEMENTWSTVGQKKSPTRI
jgi:hypothetical protein